MKHISFSFFIARICFVLFIMFSIALFSSCSFAFSYTFVLQENWDITIPISSGCKEIYKKSETSFHGDGVRYHVYSYTNIDVIKSMFLWSNVQSNTKYFSTYSETSEEWLNKLGVPYNERPQYFNCSYWYEIKENNELLICWDKKESKIYILESFL